MKRYDVLSGVSQRTGDPDCSHGSVHNSCRSTEWGSVDLLSLSHCLPAGVQWLLHQLHRVQLGLV